MYAELGVGRSPASAAPVESDRPRPVLPRPARPVGTANSDIQPPPWPETESPLIQSKSAGGRLSGFDK